MKKYYTCKHGIYHKVYCGFSRSRSKNNSSSHSNRDHSNVRTSIHKMNPNFNGSNDSNSRALPQNAS